MMAPLLFLGMLLAVGYWLLASRPTLPRVGAYVALLLVASAMCAFAFGVPRPGVFQWRPISGTLLSYALDEGHAIYVWVQPDGVAEPLALRLPWSQRTAAKLDAAKVASRRDGVPIRVGGKRGKPGRGDSLRGPDDPLNVHLAPIAPSPPKGHP